MTAEHKAGAQPGKARGVVSPWGAPSAREQQREAKRNAVLTTAARMFNERGFHATSLDDIAASLNVTKPTLYYYVKNKDEILLACVNKGLRMTLDGIEASRQAGGNALDQLRACMQVYAEIVVQPFGMCLIRVGDEEVPEPSRTELRRMKSEIDLAFRRLVARGVEEGSIAPCDPKIMAFVIAGALSWIGRWYQPEGSYSAQQVIEQCLAALLGGVLTRASGPKRVARKSGRTPS
ncbi:MAG: TetR/AcrR family transcriptional regulator [Comamonas sp.]